MGQTTPIRAGRFRFTEVMDQEAEEPEDPFRSTEDSVVAAMVVQ